MSIAVTMITTCLLFLLVSSFTRADEADINCLKSIKSQVEDPNGYLSDWQFVNETKGFICRFSGITCWNDDENRVSSIQLSGYGLKGKFPLGINNCSSLSELDLSRNNFSGPLPSKLSSFSPFLVAIDLSYNSLSGEIPVGLSNFTFLINLMLQHNQFTGKLPSELVLLRRLNKFSVADNLLTGPIPKFNPSLNIGADSFGNNKGLCGLPLDACVDPERDLIRLGTIGAAIGVAIFAPLGGGLGWFFFNRKERQRVIRHRR